jgi:hypothetical protein
MVGKKTKKCYFFLFTAIKQASRKASGTPREHQALKTMNIINFFLFEGLFDLSLWIRCATMD